MLLDPTPSVRVGKSPPAFLAPRGQHAGLTSLRLNVKPGAYWPPSQHSLGLSTVQILFKTSRSAQGYANSLLFPGRFKGWKYTLARALLTTLIYGLGSTTGLYCSYDAALLPSDIVTPQDANGKEGERAHTSRTLSTVSGLLMNRMGS